jgi:hypothetical protein
MRWGNSRHEKSMLGCASTTVSGVTPAGEECFHYRRAVHERIIGQLLNPAGCARSLPGAPCLALFARRRNPHPATREKSILSSTVQS